MLTNKRLDYVFGLVVLGAILLACTACSYTANTQPANSTEQDANTSTPTVIRNSSRIVFRSFEELAQAADIVVIARVKASEKIVNSSRNPANPAEPSSREYHLAQVYRVEIEEYIKGSGPGEIYLTQGQGLIKIEGEAPSAAELEKIASQNRGVVYLPLQMDTPYLMFLANSITDFTKEGFALGSIYIGLRPWRFILTDPEWVTVEIEDEYADLVPLFPPQPLTSILEANHAVRIRREHTLSVAGELSPLEHPG